jgi:two-component system nitrogen regulation response regulator GlnG|tara:strand:+ start:3300 stop:4676 length:1377 start_codon:yes stop_codon:yes gene_type:complete
VHKIWVADDDSAIRVVLEESFSSSGFDVKTFSSGDDVVTELKLEAPDLILTDVQMPGMLGYDLLKHINDNYENIPVIIMTAFTDMQAAVDSYGGGAFEYITKPFDLENVTQIINRALEKKPITKGLKAKPKTDIIGESLSMQGVFRAIGKLSSTTATVLVQGESGTGKELIAKSLHKNSPRYDMPFIALNMADIPKELVESELFGHEKGAFTGAVERRIGRFEQANGGTLFLDEIGDMPLDSQTRLLRVLSNKEFYRVGGDKPIKVDVRIIAATHQNLHNLVSQKSFREDLFYRLNVIKIEVPALRSRKEDIDALAKHFLKQHSDSLGEELRVISKEAMEVLSTYDWPGNVRQLENICYWLTLMTPTQNVKVQDMPSEIKDHEVIDLPSSNWEEGLTGWINNNAANLKTGLSDVVNSKVEKMLIRSALEKSDGKKNEAAILLGWGRNTLAKKMKELGI